MSALSVLIRLSLLHVVAVSPVCAATPAEVKACETYGDKQIAACTRIIQNTRETSKVRIRAYEKRAWAHSYKEQYDAAERDLDEAIKLDPRQPSTYATRARILEARNLDRAIADYTSAIEIEDAAYLRQSRARLYATKGDVQRATTDFNVALKLIDAQIAKDANNAWLYRERSDVLRDLGRYSEAVVAFTTHMKFNKEPVPGDVGHRGDLHARKSNWTNALADYNVAIKETDIYPTWYLRKALALRMSGDNVGAVRTYDALMHKWGGTYETYLGRGMAYAAMGRPNRAVIDFTKAIEEFPEDASAYYDRAQAHRENGNPELALDDYAKAIELDPKFAVAYNSRGRAYEMLGKNSDALKDYDQAISIDKELAAAYFNRAVLNRNAGRRDKGLSDVSTAIGLAPHNARFRLERAKAFSDEGAFREAEADLSAALHKEPLSVTALISRALVRIQLQKLTEAADDINRALLVNGRSAEAFLARSALLERQGNSEGAKQDADAAAKLLRDQASDAQKAVEERQRSQSVRVVIKGEFETTPAYGTKLKLDTILEIRGDSVTYWTPPLNPYRMANGDTIEEDFPGLCSNRTTTNMGHRIVSASHDRDLIHASLQSRLDFTTGDCRGRHNYYKEFYLVDIANGECKFTFRQDRDLFGVGAFDNIIMDQPCRIEPPR